MMIGYRVHKPSGYSEFTNRAIAIDEVNRFGLQESDIEEYEIPESPIDPPPLRIATLVDPQFAGLSADKIDFRKHLLSGVHVQKDVEMLINGRPECALYKHNGTLIARIRFEFELNAFFLMERRKEILGYYVEGGEDLIPEEYVISDEIYDLAGSSYHLTKSMEERSTCRNYVLENMKATLNGFILQYYMSLGQEFMPILNTVSQFFNTYSTDLTTWLQTGAGNFKQVALDDTTYDFLDLEMQPGFSVRAYIVYRLENA